MRKIFWDTNPFIYLFEKNPQHWKRAKEIREAMRASGDQLVTSAMTVGEIQVKPVQTGHPEEAQRYRNTILQSALVVPFDIKAADAYASIRSTSSVRGADAIQLACASAADVHLFITNDTHLLKLRIPGIRFFISSLEQAPI